MKNAKKFVSKTNKIFLTVTTREEDGVMFEIILDKATVHVPIWEDLKSFMEDFGPIMPVQPQPWIRMIVGIVKETLVMVMVT